MSLSQGLFEWVVFKSSLKTLQRNHKESRNNTVENGTVPICQYATEHVAKLITITSACESQIHFLLPLCIWLAIEVIRKTERLDINIWQP